MSDDKYDECPNVECAYRGSRNVYRCTGCGFEGCWDHGEGCWPGQLECPNCGEGGQWERAGHIGDGV